MIQGTQWKDRPHVALRVPGPWKDVAELCGRLPAGVEIREKQLVLSDDRRFHFEPLAADDQFARIFRMVCQRRPKAKELRGLDAYAMNAAVVGPGGSVEALQDFIEAGAALVQAGGVGVFIDNSAIAHGASDWLELAENRHERDAVVYTFVAMADIQKTLFSIGMHTLGLRDIIVPHDSGSRPLGASVWEFLRAACAERIHPRDRATFTDSQGNRFRLHDERDFNPEGHPMCNPYGRWRLEPLS